MIYDGIKLIEGSALENPVISAGTSFPANPDEGELFVRTDVGNAGFYIYQNSVWARLVKDGEVAGGATAVGASGTIQLSNGAGALTTLDNFRWNTSLKALLVDTSFGMYPSDLPSGSSGAEGRSLAIKGGAGGNGIDGGTGGALHLFGGSGGTGTTGSAGNGGALRLFGGNAGTDGNSQGNGGWVQIYGGSRHSSGTPGSVAIYTNGTERFRVSNTGAFGLSGANYGTSGQVLTSQGSSSAPIWTTLDTFASNTLVTLDTVQTITANKTFTGALMVGTTSAIVQSDGTSAALMVASTATATSRLSASIFRNDVNSAGIVFTKSRGASIGTHTILQNGDGIGFIPFEGSTGSEYAKAATISVVVDGAPSSTSMPGKIIFSTTPSGTKTPVDRLTLNASGSWTINSSPGFAGQVLLSNGPSSSPSWRDLPNPAKLERVTTFNTNARGKRVALSAGVTIPALTYEEGDAFSFYNTTGSAITITQGSGLTLRQDGTTNTGSRTLAPYGTCFIWFNAVNEAIISGSVS